MTNDDLRRRKLDELLALPQETEWVEFKVSIAEPDAIGEYISALANSAALLEKSRAYLVWGVENETHRVVGTTFKPRKQKGAGNEDLEPWLTRSLAPRIDFTFHEFRAIGGEWVVVLEIQAANSTPVRFKESEWVRVGSHKKRLREHPEKERKLWALLSASQFESGIATTGISGDEVLSGLDYSSYFTLTNQRLPESKAGILERLRNEALLVPSGADRFDVTNLGAILFSRDLSQFGRLGRKAIRVIKYSGTGRVVTEREWNDPPARMGYAAGFESAIAFINSQLPQNEHIEEAFRRTARLYPEIAVRELVANALIHQDFSVTGAGPVVELFDDRMELTNPGESLVASDRFIDLPPRSRNESLAGFMRRVNICEERGSGIDKVITSIEAYQLPPPDFRTPTGSTQVVLFAPRKFADMSTAERVRACYQHCVLRWLTNSLMTNTTLRERLGIADANYSMASRVIRDALDQALIKPHDPKTSPRYRKYVPRWA